MSDLLKDIQEAVAKTLPAHLSAELQHQLTLGKVAQKDAESLRTKLQTVEKEVDRLKAFESRSVSVETAAFTLSNERQKFEIEKREFQIKCLNEKYCDVKSLMHDVFRNQRIVWKATEREYVEGHSTPNGYVGGHQSTNETEEERIEE